MKKGIFKPNPRYLTKMRLIIHITAVVILAGGLLLAVLVSLDDETDTDTLILIVAIVAGIDVIWWLPALMVTGPYYRSLSYEVQDDEVIVQVGIWTKSVKHVPYRTVTNLVVKRDILDRWMGIGTLNIQTAGMSGTTGAEESLVGLDNVQDVYDVVVQELRRFRGAMAPTAAGMEGDLVAEETGAVLSIDVLTGILSEVRAIREALEND